MKEVVVKCPSCGTYVKGKTGLFASTVTCKKCGQIINPKKDSDIVVTCHHCGNDVVFDTRNPGAQVCPICKTSLASYMINDVEVECPYCHTHEMVKNNETIHTCPICGKGFDVQKAKAKKEAATGTASVITVPYDNENVIWVHPETSFPYASQVVVPEGYTALILRNGRCSAPSMPGNYLLSDSLKSLGDQLQDAVFNPNAQVFVQIIFVRNIIDSNFGWTNIEDGDAPVSDGTDQIVGKLGLGGRIGLKVTDAKKFAEFVGFGNATVQDLIGFGQPLHKRVCKECFTEGSKILLLSVYRGEFTYKGLTTNTLLFEDDIQNAVDKKLADIGLQSSFFQLEFISFKENEKVAQTRNITEFVSTFIEKPIEWESDYMRLKMDISYYADVKFGGKIKFLIIDSNAFLKRNEVKSWTQNGVREDALKTYFSGLAATAADDVLTTVVQQRIDETGASIINLTALYIEVKDIIKREMEAFFRGYGLAMEQFSFKEIDRKNSASLAKFIESEQYKTKTILDKDTHIFDNEIEVEIYESDINKTLKIDDIDTGAETHLTGNDSQRNQNTIARLAGTASVQNASEVLKREAQKRRKGWIKEDIKEAHQDHIESIMNQGEVDSALHYLNQQNIQNQAEELRAKWEEQSRLDYDKLLHSLRMRKTQDDDSDDRAWKKWKLNSEQKIGDAENERILNSIFRKIAESDLELTQKINEYNRILNNEIDADDLRHYVDWKNAENNVYYDENHIRNILTDEEYKILEDARQRASDRNERIKDADFYRSLKLKEVNIAHEMEILQMAYDAAEKQSQNDLALQNKQFEIDALKAKLGHLQKLDDNEVRRVGILANSATAQSQAESRWKAELARSEREAERKREQDRLDREDAYSKRADELLTKMLSIQAALKMLGFENEKTAITGFTDIAIARAKAEAEAATMGASQMDSLMKALKVMAGSSSDKSGSKATKSGTTGQGGGTDRGITMGGLGMNPGTRKCPHCGRPLPDYARTVCPNCYELI